MILMWMQLFDWLIISTLLVSHRFVFPDCTRDGTGFQKLQVTGSQRSQSGDYCCSPRAWRLLRKLPKRPVSAVSHTSSLRTPFRCKNGVGGATQPAYFMIAFQSLHELHFTRVVTPRAGSGWGTEKILWWSEKELFGPMILAYLLISIWEKQLEEMERKGKTRNGKKRQSWWLSTTGIADHFTVFLVYALVWFFGEGRRYCYWWFR